MLLDLLAERGTLLADGATGTNYFDRGLIDGQVAGERELPDYARDIIERPTL